MSGGRLLHGLTLAGVIAGSTWLAGWWAVPLVCFAWASLRPTATPWHAGVAAGVAWGALLGALPSGEMGRLAERLGGVFSMPWAAPVLITIGVAGAMGWSAARLGAALRDWITPSSSDA